MDDWHKHRRIEARIEPLIRNAFCEEVGAALKVSVSVYKGRTDLCVSLSNPYRRAADMSFMIDENIIHDATAMRDFCERVGRKYGEAVNRHDFDMFKGWEVVPDMSAHTWVDPVDGITKRAGATPKYLKKRPNSERLYGMSDDESLIYDSLKSRPAPKERGEDEPWIRDRQSGLWFDQADAERRDALREQARLTKEAQEAEKRRLIEEAERAEQMKEQARDSFYGGQDDYGAF